MKPVSKVHEIAIALKLTDDQIDGVLRVAKYAGPGFIKDEALIREALNAHPGKSTLWAAQTRSELNAELTKQLQLTQEQLRLAMRALYTSEDALRQIEELDKAGHFLLTPPI